MEPNEAIDWAFIAGPIISGILLLYYLVIYPYQYWARKDLSQVTTVPFLGSNFKSIIGLIPQALWQNKVYTEYAKEKLIGMYTLTVPTLMIKDPEMIERVLIKDFSSFYNRGSNVDTNREPLSAHLVNLEDGKWRSLRNKLSPTFTSGKLKGMIPQIVDCGNLLINHIMSYTDPQRPFEVRDVLARFTTDVISSCAFGLNTNALKDPNSEFRKMGKRVFRPTVISKVRRILRMGFPNLMRWFPLRSFPVKLEKFFENVVKETIETREKNGIRRNDFLQLMADLKKKDQNEQPKEGEIIMDDKLIASNAFVFFLAGFETTASTISYCLYELSKDEQLQEKLYIEIKKCLDIHGGEISREALKSMSYLEKVVAETLRLHPPASETARVASKPYKIPGTSVVIDKGVRVVVPIYSLHHDPKYYPEPDKFDPDRFGDTYSPPKGTYLPFGDGPRICIGMRFAKIEIKVALTMILTKFKLKLSEKTISPLKYDPKTILLVPLGGIWLEATPR